MNTKAEEKGLDVTLPVRVTQDLAKRVEKLLEEERIRTNYKVSRSNILRRVVLLGVEQLEKLES